MCENFQNELDRCLNSPTPETMEPIHETSPEPEARGSSPSTSPFEDSLPHLKIEVNSFLHLVPDHGESNFKSLFGSAPKEGSRKRKDKYLPSFSNYNGEAGYLISVHAEDSDPMRAN